MELVNKLHVADHVRIIRLDSSGKYLAVSSGPQDILIFNIKDMAFHLAGTLMGSGTSPDAPILDMAFHPRDPLLAVAGQDRSVGIWDVVHCVQVAEFAPLDLAESRYYSEQGSWGVSFSHCGQYVDIHSMDRCQGERYDWQTGEIIATRWGTGGPIASHRENGLQLVCSVREMGTLAFIGRWIGQDFEWFNPQLTTWFPVTRAVFSQGLIGFVGGSGSLNVQVHEFPSCQVRFWHEMDETPEHVQFPFDVSEALAISDSGAVFGPSVSGEVIGWSSLDGAEVNRCHAHTDMVMSLALHPLDPLLISGSWDGTIALIRLEATRTKPTRNKESEFIHLFSAITGDPVSAPDTDFISFEP